MSGIKRLTVVHRIGRGSRVEGLVWSEGREMSKTSLFKDQQAKENRKWITKCQIVDM